MVLCKHGCGNLGIFQNVDGTFRCKEFATQCESNRKKNQSKHKVLSQFDRRQSFFKNNPNTIKKVCVYCQKDIPLTNLKAHENSCYLNPNNLKYCPVCFEIVKSKESITCSYECANLYFKEKYKDTQRQGKYKRWPDSKSHYRTISWDNHEKKCIVCNEERIVAVHHYDKNKKNNSPENLIPLCPTHHVYIHSRYKELILDKVQEFRQQFIDSKEKK